MKKILIVLAVVAVAYSGFWLFQANRIKTNLSKDFTVNGQTFSNESVKVSGFPFYKNASIKNAKVTTKEGSSFTVKEVKVKVGVFDSYSKISEMSISDPFVFSKNGQSAVLEFNPGSKINVFAKNGKVSQLKIVHTGYKLTSEQTNNLIYSTSSTNSEVEVNFNDENLNYHSNDAGLKIANSKGEIFFEAESINVNLDLPRKPDSTQSRIALDLDLKDFFVQKNLPDQILQLANSKKNLNFKGEILFSVNKEAAKNLNPKPKFLDDKDILLTLNNLGFSDQDFEISASGSLNKSAIEKLPTVEFEITIKDIDNILKKISPSDATQDKFIKPDEVIKQIANINPASKDNISAINIKMDKSTGNDVNFNDVGYKTIKQALRNISIKKQIDKLEEKKKELKDKFLQQAAQAQINYLEQYAEPISTFDPKKIDPTTLNSKNIDVSKIDQSLGQEKINQFYKILSNQKIRNMENTIKQQSSLNQAQ